MRAISSSQVVGDDGASPSPSLLDLASQAPSALVPLSPLQPLGPTWCVAFQNASSQIERKEKGHDVAQKPFIFSARIPKKSVSLLDWLLQGGLQEAINPVPVHSFIAGSCP